MDLTRPTRLLDYHHPRIRALIATRGWQKLEESARIGAAYAFVRDEIAFGYNAGDALPASRVLADGYGQCNTKAILLMALLRALGIACRLHGFTIHKALQRGVVPELIYRITPENILHSWVEVKFQGRWVNLEGFILDTPYLTRLQAAFAGAAGLCGYGAGTENLAAPGVEWCGRDTYIQRSGINRDFGLFDDPDSFYARHAQDLPWWKERLYRHLLRHWMNARVRRFRAGARLAPLPGHAHPQKAPRKP